MANVSAPFKSANRITVLHKNIPNMLGQISTIIAQEGINIENLVNSSKDDYAYTMVDVEEMDNDSVQEIMTNLENIPAVTRVRLLNNPYKK